ncbi:MAG: sulfotransferase family 2 domain-containing protein [Bacteroidota bacterium]
MIELISIHLPKTGGTSFYHILQQVYGEQLSISYKRRDLRTTLEQYPSFADSLPQHISVLHGHFYYKEIQHLAPEARLICWLRDPVQRVISNYRFFKAGLDNPSRNPASYALNKHRRGESLLDYARLAENQNRMSSFLDGLDLAQCFFVGLLENFAADVDRLSKLLDWPEVVVPQLNQSKNMTSIDTSTLRQLAEWNAKDCELYDYACSLLGINFGRTSL